MRKKLMLRYGVLSLPFVCGLVLYGTGSYNIVSSLLFFVGGYIVVKNLCDYRKIKKNIKIVSNKKKKELEKNIDNSIYENVIKKDIDNYNDRDIDKRDERDNVSIQLDDGMECCIDIVNNEENVDISSNKYKNYDSIPGLKRIRRYTKVRRRY